MSADPFAMHISYPSNNNSNKKDFGNLIVNRTFLCMERLNNITTNKREEKLSFDCQEYNTVEDAIVKIREERNHNRRVNIVQIPKIISESLLDKVLYYHLRKEYWGNVKRI